jgi:DNA-binding XRE family transcriptional regulator
LPRSDPSELSVFKIIQKSDYLKSPYGSARGLNLAKTLGSRRHKALIALLIERREAAGMTQTQLAGRLGEYQSFVARLESGQRRVDVVEFLELAEVLGFDARKALAAVKKIL